MAMVASTRRVGCYVTIVNIGGYAARCYCRCEERMLPRRHAYWLRDDEKHYGIGEMSSLFYTTPVVVTLWLYVISCYARHGVMASRLLCSTLALDDTSNTIIPLLLFGGISLVTVKAVGV